MFPSITGRLLPEGAADVLREILAKSGLDHCAVTSVARTPRDQANVMFNNCVAHGVLRQYDLYRDSGDEVIKVFEDNYKRKPEHEVIALMEKKIRQIGPEKVSHHCCDPEKSPVWVFDVAPSTIPEHKRAEFMGQARAHPRVVKVLGPNNADPAFHLEVNKNAGKA